jgi:hypothetical protein
MLMTNYLINGGIVAFIYFLLIILRNKYIIKKDKPIKELVTDSVMVFLSAMLGEFAIGKLDKGILKSSTPTAFLGKPEF